MICDTCKNKPCLIYKMAPLKAIKDGKKCAFYDPKLYLGER